MAGFDSAPWPKRENDSENASRVGQHVTAEPEPEPEPMAEPPPSGPEPIPEWSTAMDQWQEAWETHVYGLGLIFAALAIFTAVSAFLAWQKVFRRTPITFPTLLMLFILGVSRAVYLLGDAYRAYSRFPLVVSQVLYGMAFPCVTSAYGLLLNVLLSSMKFRLLAKNRRRRLLWIVISIHWTLNTSADVLLARCYKHDFAKYTAIACQVVFVFWALTLFLGYLWTGYNLRTRRRSRTAIMSSHGSLRSKTSQQVNLKSESQCNYLSRKRLSLQRANLLICVTTGCGFILVGLYLYGLFGVFSVLEKNKLAPAWPWWAYQTAARVLELIMGYLMLFTTAITRENVMHLYNQVSIKRKQSLMLKTNTNQSGSPKECSATATVTLQTNHYALSSVTEGNTLSEVV